MDLAFYLRVLGGEQEPEAAVVVLGVALALTARQTALEVKV
ncbi:MAG: hypothetical protein ACLPLP_21420 [Mycobacterium sp.]